MYNFFYDILSSCFKYLFWSFKLSFHGEQTASDPTRHVPYFLVVMRRVTPVLEKELDLCLSVTNSLYLR